VLYDRAGKMDAADREYRAAMTEMGEQPDLLSDYGYFLYCRGKVDEAETLLRTAIKKQPKHNQATVNLALVVGARGNYDEAQSLFTEAIGPAAALHNIGMLKLRSGDQAGAIENLRSASIQDPSLAESRQVLAKLTLQNH
jgi:Flp pilus assembly protein TadD